MSQMCVSRIVYAVIATQCHPYVLLKIMPLYSPNSSLPQIVSDWVSHMLI